MISKDISGIKNGDFEVKESDLQHIQDILMLGKGQLYEFPTLGYDINSKINGSLNAIDEKRKIRDELTKDNYAIQQLSITSDFQISVSANKIK